MFGLSCGLAASLVLAIKASKAVRCLPAPIRRFLRIDGTSVRAAMLKQFLDWYSKFIF
jgi:hypothetical protein